MKIEDIVILIISELGGKLSGRTKIQKLCYFYSIITGRKMGFIPHFYGPYSPQIETALDELEGIGLIKKYSERLGENPNGFDRIRYNYWITKYGKQVVDMIGDNDERNQLKEFIEKIELIGIPSASDLSVAAKAHYILNKQNKPLTDNEIRKRAETLGWDISTESINKAINFLTEFGLLN
jgi:uncharacterized protein